MYIRLAFVLTLLIQQLRAASKYFTQSDASKMLIELAVLLAMSVLVLPFPTKTLQKVFNFQRQIQEFICPLYFITTSPSTEEYDLAKLPLNNNQDLLPEGMENYKKWLAHCDTVIVNIRGFNFGSFMAVRNYYIFIGEGMEIKAAFQSPFIRRLKFKVGIAPDEETPDEYTFLPFNSIRDTHVRISTWKLDPWFAELHKNGQIVRTGVHFNIVPLASKVYNFTYDLSVHPPGFHLLPNGNWAGVMGDLQRGESDILLALGPRIHHWSISSAGSILYAIELAFMTKIPQPSVSWTAFFAPFSVLVWITVAAAAVIVFLTGVSLLTLSKSEQPIFYAALNTYSPILGQGGVNLSADSLGSEIVFLTWIFCSTVIGTYYCSDLLAKITIPTAELVPSTFKELAHRRDYKLQLWYFGGSLADIFFKASTTPLYRDMNKRIVRVNSGLECARAAITTDRQVCISFNSLIDSLLVNFNCNDAQRTLKISDNTYSVYVAVLYQKNSKYQNDFDRTVSRIRDAGFYPRWIKGFFDMRKREKTSKSKCKDYGTTVGAFSLKLLAVPFQVLVIGTVVSLLIFLANLLKSYRSYMHSLEQTKWAASIEDPIRLFFQVQSHSRHQAAQ